MVYLPDFTKRKISPFQDRTEVKAQRVQPSPAQRSSVNTTGAQQLGTNPVPRSPLDELRYQRNKDRAMGEAAGQISLPRIQQAISPAMQATIDRLNSLSQTGMSSAESERNRNQAIKRIQANQAGAAEGLAGQLGAAGVRGGAAAAQFRNLANLGSQQMADVELALLNQDESIKRQALGDLLQAQRFSDIFNREGDMFNAGQAQNEQIFPKLFGLTEAQIGSAERTGLAQQNLANRSWGGGKKGGGSGSSFENAAVPAWLVGLTGGNPMLAGLISGGGRLGRMDNIGRSDIGRAFRQLGIRL